ncbi:MAG: hypothetical protein U0R44_07065 [Candidatus Micrarchaeia archaeon]
MDRKGFLFTVTVFLILTYILLSISVWVKSIEASERSFSEFYKESTVELTIEQITPNKMDNVSKIIMSRSLARLDDHAAQSPLREGPSGDENRNVRAALFDLLVNGSAEDPLFYGSGIPAEANSSLTAWAQNLNASLRAIGVYMSDFQVTNFHADQNDIDSVNYSFDIRLELKDYTNTSSVSRTYHITNALDVTGLVDPALARLSERRAGDNQTVYRQFFFNKDIYPNYTSIAVDKISQPVSGGQGWIYGALAKASGSGDLVPVWYNVSPSQRNMYILVGTFDEINALDRLNSEEFGGYILTNAPSHPTNCSGKLGEAQTFNPVKYSGPGCDIGFDDAAGASTSKPFIVAPGFNSSNAPKCPILDGSESFRRCVLLLNTYLESEVAASPGKKLATGGAGLFRLESIRDFVMCGYYTHNPDAPSYMQRLLNNSYSKNSSQFGIETFVIGNYANNYSIYDINSRLDRELFNGSISGIKIRGLPGCRNFNTCADSPVTGIFAVSGPTKSNYGLGQVSCDNGAAGCNP